MAGGLKGLGPKEVLSLKKDRLLTCLNKLNDRDTQKRAAEELSDLLQDRTWLDLEAVPITVHSLCNTGSEQKVYARKEVARALARLASSTCPQRNAAISSPLLSKVVAQLKKLMQDSDSSVREAASEAMAAVAHGLAQIDAPEAFLPTSQHPIGKAVLECLPDGKKDLQAAACQALGQAAQFCGQVDHVLVKEVLKRMSTQSFQAAHALLSAVGRVDAATNTPQGLLAAAPGAFQPHLNFMVGQPASGPSITPQTPGSGLCGCLASKDWQTRKAAADCVRCAALVLGPLLEGEGGWVPNDPKSLTHRIIRALEGPKFDKVKEVRETAREAYSLVDTLMAYGRSGGGTGGWAEQAAGAGVGTSISDSLGDSSPPIPTLHRARSPPQARAASPASRGARPPSPPRQSAFQRNSSLAERFRKAADEKDQVMDIASRANSRPQTAIESISEQNHLDGITPSSSGPLSRPASTDGGGVPEAVQGGFSLIPPPVTRSSSGVSRPGSSRPGSAKFPANNEDLGPDHALDVTLMDRPPSSAVLNATPSMMAQPPATSSSGRMQPSGRGSRPPSGSGLPSSANPPRPTSAASRPGDHAGLQTVTVSLTEWQALQRQIRDMEARHRELVDAMAVQSATSTRTISELQDRIRLLESQPPPQQQQPTTTTNPTNAVLTVLSAPPIITPPPVPSSPPRTASPLGFPSAKYAIPNPPLQPPSSPARRIQPLSDPWASSAVLSPGQQPTNGANGLPPLIQSSEPALSTSPSFANARHMMAGSSPSPAESPKASLSNISIMQPISPSRSGNQQGALLDVNAAYQEALAAGPASAEMQRLLSRTGAAWSALNPDVAHTLLRAFMGLLQDPFTLPRVLPWLWRLADESQAPGLQEAGITSKEQEDLLTSLQTAVQAWQQANHPEMASKLQLLHQTLQSHWNNINTNGPTTSGAPSPTSVNQHPSRGTTPVNVGRTGSRPWSGHGGGGGGPTDMSGGGAGVVGTSRMGPGRGGPGGVVLGSSPSGVWGAGDAAVTGSESGRLRSLTPAQVRAAAASELQPSLSAASSTGSGGGTGTGTGTGSTPLPSDHTTMSIPDQHRPSTALPRSGTGSRGSFTPTPPLTSVPNTSNSRPTSAAPHTPSPQQGLYEGVGNTDLPAQAPRPFSSPQHTTPIPQPTTTDPYDDMDSSQSQAVLKATFSGGLSAAAATAATMSAPSTTTPPVDHEPSLTMSATPPHTTTQTPSIPVPLPAMPQDTTSLSTTTPSLSPIDTRRMSEPVPASSPIPLGLPPPAPSTDNNPGPPARRQSADRLPRTSSGAAPPPPSGLRGAGSRDRSPLPPTNRSPSATAASAGGGRTPGLQQLKSNFEALERDFMQSPAFLKARMLTEAAKERAASVSPPLSECGQGMVADQEGNVVAVLPPSHLRMGVAQGDEPQGEEGVEVRVGVGQRSSGGGGAGGGSLRQSGANSPVATPTSTSHSDGGADPPAPAPAPPSTPAPTPTPAPPSTPAPAPTPE